MQIGDLAESTGASVRSLRHYETAGLLSPRRRPNGYREYSADDVERVRRIRALLAAGLSLAELRPLLSCLIDDRPTLLRCAVTTAAVQRGVSELDRQIGELAHIRAVLADALTPSGSDNTSRDGAPR
ncbi:MerR family transcriptional regulator [Dactylosporangium cerinum]|uniref:MerR family transcriptional regulator n=1 Tax=Dactylosporangium cerinum TaxID=1434730 RepID=A0ABV9WIF2_9ACTN